MKKSLLGKLLILYLTIFSLIFIFTGCNMFNGQPDSSHVHDYKTIKYNQEKHWFECDCGEKSNETNHSLVNDSCICGYTVNQSHVHDYSLLKYDALTHWFECLCGEKNNMANHSGGTATEDSRPICKICRQEYGSVLGHVHNYNQEIVSSLYLKEPAKCESKAQYYYSCNCGEKGKETFESGAVLGHAYGDFVSVGNAQHKKTCVNDNSHTVTEDCSGGAATCTQKAKCKDCGAEYGSTLGHNYGNPTYTWDNNQCTAARVCLRNINHEETETVVGTYYKDTDATCTALEKGHYVASFTNSNFTTQATEKNSASVGETKPHNYNKLEKSATQHWYECVCGDKNGIEGHNPGANATETTDQKCTECDYIITPALNHVHTLHLIKVDAVAQSCTEEGNIEYYTCSCGKWFTDNTASIEITDIDSVVVAKDDHEYKKLEKSSTEHWYECVCGDKNNVEAHKGGSATCKVKAVCEVCTVAYGGFAEHAQKQIWETSNTHHYHECVYGCTEKLNYGEHDWDTGIITKTPTNIEKGEKTFTCTICSKTKIEKISINGSTIVVSSKSVNKGENVEIIVSIYNNPGIWSALLEIEIDANVFEFVSYDISLSIFNDFGECGFDSNDNKFKFNGQHNSVENNETKDGVIFKITLKAKDNIAEKSSNLMLDIIEVINVDMQDILLNKIDGNITIEE